MPVGLACGDQRRIMGNGSALEVVPRRWAIQIHDFTLLLLYFLREKHSYWAGVINEKMMACCVRRKNVLVSMQRRGWTRDLRALPMRSTWEVFSRRRSSALPILAKWASRCPAYVVFVQCKNFKMTSWVMENVAAVVLMPYDLLCHSCPSVLRRCWVIPLAKSSLK